MIEKQPVSIFFSIDSNYLPFFSVAVTSIINHMDLKRQYNIYVLHNDLTDENITKAKKLETNNLSINFVNVLNNLNALSSSLMVRDYYTLTTYYRLFITELFPDLEKALYLDSDTVVNTDIAELFDIDLHDNLIGGIVDGAVSVVEPFQLYTKNVLGIEASKYFNAGIILMNLNKMRQFKFYDKFIELIKEYKFIVAQDQDYLNVLCKDRVLFLDEAWNVMPIKGRIEEKNNPKLIHYNLTAKPWHYKNLQYEKYFWYYARQTEYFDYILSLLENYTDFDKQNDERCESSLIKLCFEEVNNCDNFIKRNILLSV